MYYYAYILASIKNGTLYIGYTQDLIKRVWQHKNKLVDGFTKKYKVNMLVYYEVSDSKEGTLQREKQLKKWNRAWKIKMIERFNPMWQDLYFGLLK